MNTILLNSKNIKNTNAFSYTFLTETNWILNCIENDPIRFLYLKRFDFLETKFQIIEGGCRITSTLPIGNLLQLKKIDSFNYPTIALTVSSLLLVSAAHNLKIENLYTAFTAEIKYLIRVKSEILILEALIKFHLVILQKTGYSIDWSCRRCDTTTRDFSTNYLLCSRCCHDNNLSAVNSDAFLIYQNLTQEESISLNKRFDINDYKILLIYIILHFQEYFEKPIYYNWLLK